MVGEGSESPSTRDQEEAFRSRLIKALPAFTNVGFAYLCTDRGSPGAIVPTEEGYFLVTVRKVAQGAIPSIGNHPQPDPLKEYPPDPAPKEV